MGLIVNDKPNLRTQGKSHRDKSGGVLSTPAGSSGTTLGGMVMPGATKSRSSGKARTRRRK